MTIHYKVIFSVVAVVLMGVVGGFGYVQAQATTNSVTEENHQRVIISFADTPGESGRALVRALGGDVRYEYGSVPAIAARVPEAAIAGLERNPRIANIVVDEQVEVQSVELSNAWGVEHIGAGEVHDNDTVTGSGVRIGIIDSGINYHHPELTDNYRGGYDFFYFNDDPMDVYGHGTHVAGTACATYNDNATTNSDGSPLYGVVGVAPECELYALRVLNEDGVGYWSDIAAAVEWSTGEEEVWLEGWQDVKGRYVSGERMDVVNLSLGKSGHPGDAVEAIFANAYEAGVLIVAAAGNSGNRGGNNDTVIYPAKFDSVIAVAATDDSDSRATFSSTGPAVELAAPGVAVYSTWNNDVAYYGTPNCRGELVTHHFGGEHELAYSSVDSVQYGDCYKFGSGTSMASPHVAGTAALLWATNPDLSVGELRAILRDTADNLGPAHRYGSGMVNVVAGVAAALSATPPEPALHASLETNQQQYVYDEDSVTAQVTVRDEYDNPVTGLAGTSFVTTLNGESVDVVFTESENGGEYLGGLDESMPVGEYTMSVTVTSDDLSATATTTFTVVEASEDDGGDSGSDHVMLGVSEIRFETRGGKDNDRHLDTFITIADENGEVIEGATVQSVLYLNDVDYASHVDSTDSTGVIQHSYNNAPSGAYELKVFDVDAPEGYQWDETEETKTFEKE